MYAAEFEIRQSTAVYGFWNVHIAGDPLTLSRHPSVTYRVHSFFFQLGHLDGFYVVHGLAAAVAHFY